MIATSAATGPVAPAGSGAGHPRKGVEPFRLRFDEESLRRPMLTLEELRRHAQSLAAEHQVVDRPARAWFLARLDDMSQTWDRAQLALRDAVAQRRPVTPAAVWLLDNDAKVREQIRSARRAVPRRHRLELPHLASPSGYGRPRMFELVLELVANADGQIDQSLLGQFVGAYQSVAHLRLKELWASPTLLRLALLENLGRLAEDVGRRGHDWLAVDPRIQAADQVSVHNHLASLRELAEIDWREFVESHSVLEQILRRDPDGTYPRMTFATRDHYRHVVERIAARSGHSEEQVAQAALEQALRSEGLGKRRHVGYHLVDRGRPELERRVGYRPTWRETAARVAGRLPMNGYLAAVLATTSMAIGLVAWGGWRLGAIELAGPWGGLLLAVLLTPAATHFAIGLVNWLSTLFVPPRRMMRLDFSKGIPDECRTVVAVPTMLTDCRGVHAIVAHLEDRYLANREANLRFALLTDFPDADRPCLPEDDELLALACQSIERLNARHAQAGHSVFYLLHRPRHWNPQEAVWMGEERKRGKLAALNRLLRTGVCDAFCVTAGDLAGLRGVRFVITLDTDTQLPRDAAGELVGCMAHPLNRPVLDPHVDRVVEGYGILQPRVAISIPDARRSRYCRWFAGEAGIDPYTVQTSDLYQDLFAEGSFIGKGIYDVEAFENALAGRFPDNRVLSHDLIEGCFARSGVVSDVELFEACPVRLLADMSRRHRWIRGDWQIAAWLGRRVPTIYGFAPNPLNWVSRWKIFDNLRRSLAPVFELVFLAVAVALAPQLTGYWVLLVLAMHFLPPLLAAAHGLASRPEEKPWRLHARDQATGCAKGVLREAVTLAVLPYTAHCQLDAIARTLYRLGVSRSKLLEWTTASEAELRTAAGCRDHYEIMCASTVVALGLAAIVAIGDLPSLLAAGPLVLAWLAGPWVAWRVSQPSPDRIARLSADETQRLRRWARQTWHYFDVHVNRRENWLAPDNIQQRSSAHRGRWAVAPRTSPTNIGMGLLADLAACDLGYLAAGRLVRRVDRALRSLGCMERYRGHFYNWYDTRTLQPAEPRYVSTVDSGNLWGALLVLRAGLEELRQRRLVGCNLVAGLQDTLAAIAALRPSCDWSATATFDARLAELRQVCAHTRPGGARETWRLLGRLRAMVADLARVAADAPPTLGQWVVALRRQVSTAHGELARLAFWVALPEGLEPSRLGLDPGREEILGGLLKQLGELDREGRLCDLPGAADETLAALESIAGREADRLRLLRDLAQRAARAGAASRAELRCIGALAAQCRELAVADFGFLYHARRKLLAVGFNASENRRDDGYYDLLASESRLASFLAISHGQLPQEHWFALGRLIAVADGQPVLLSWSGSMFEYLMPVLLMPSYPGALLDAGCRAAVQRQMRYGRSRGVPWGISESCYHAFDAGRSYRYRSFGVPGLGLEPRSREELVIAPYASALGAMYFPHEACANLDLLERRGYLSAYGFFDAVDHTPDRCQPAGEPVACRTVMAHHNGMTLLSLAKVLLGEPMQRRFLDNPACRSHGLLMQERVPQAIRPVDPELLAARPTAGVVARSPDELPRMPMSDATGLDARWRETLVAGPRCYLRDAETACVWGNLGPSDCQDDEPAKPCPPVSEHRVLRYEIDTRTEIGVSFEDDVEVQRLTLVNLSRVPRTIEIACCAELVQPLAGEASAGVESLAELAAVLSGVGASGGCPAWMFQLLSVEGGRAGPVRFETSRLRFQAWLDGQPRTAESADAAADPILGVCRAVTLAPDEAAVVRVVTGAADSREKALALVRRYQDPRLANRALALVKTWNSLVSPPVEAEAEIQPCCVPT